MARQPVRPEAAPAGRAAAAATRSVDPPGGAATPSVTGRRQAERPGTAQPARLRLLPGSGQRGTEGCPLVVFIGVGDDRRSRLAAALLTHRANGGAQAISMSDNPVEPDPTVVEVLGAIGVDLLGCRSWPPSPELLRRAAAVVVMGYDSQTLDELPRAQDWYIDDPAGKDRETLRYLRDAIDRQVQRLLVRIGGAAAATPALRENG
jgi:arsenate reductase (thioredoxin)